MWQVRGRDGITAYRVTRERRQDKAGILHEAFPASSPPNVSPMKWNQQAEMYSPPSCKSISTDKRVMNDEGPSHMIQRMSEEEGIWCMAERR